MRHLSSIVLAAAVVAAGTVACFSDPTSGGRNGASRIVLTRSSVFLDVGGDSLSVQAELKDDQGNTYDVSDATWTTGDDAVAVVNVQQGQYIPYDALSRAFIRAVGTGMTYVYFETHGLKDSIQVYGLATAFDGAVTSVANPTPRDTITITATSLLAFTTTGGDTSVVTVDGHQVWMLSRSATELKFLAVPVDAKTIEITNVVQQGVVTIASLPATTTLTVTDPTDPADDDPATPADMTLYQDYYGTVSAADVDDYLRFTTTTADSIRVEIFWETDSDLDGYLLDATGAGFCVLDGCAMGTGANPETYEIQLAAATTYQLLVELYDAGSADEPIMYRVRTTKIQ